MADPPTREQYLLQQLSEFADEIGETPTVRVVSDADEMPSPSTYRRWFGSWNAALREAGLNPNRQDDLSNDEALDMLREFAAKRGETPSAQQVTAADEMPSAAMYQNRFGSWNDALREAGLPVRQEQSC